MEQQTAEGIGGTQYIGFHVLQDSASNAHDVTLMNVSRLLTGTYKCEVSAGSPSYHTMIARSKMEVVSKCINHQELKTFYFHFLSGKINLPFSDCPQYTRVLFPFITAFDFKTAIHIRNKKNHGVM